jgi:hypothetical protein
MTDPSAVWILVCKRTARRVIRRKVAGAAGVVGTGVVVPRPGPPAIRQGGPVCEWKLVSTANAPLYGGALPPGFDGLPSYAGTLPYGGGAFAAGGLGVAYGAPAYAGSAFGSEGLLQTASVFGGFGGPLEGRDFAALTGVPGVSVLPSTELAVVVSGSSAAPGTAVAVVEPSSFLILGSALVLLALIRRRRHGNFR